MSRVLCRWRERDGVREYVVRRASDFPAIALRDAEALRDSDGGAAATSQREAVHTFVRDDELNMDRVPSAWGVLVPQGLTEVLTIVLVVLIALIVRGGARFVSLRSLLAAAILVAFCVIRVAWRSSTVFEERMIVIKDIGIQRITRYYGGRESYRFVESNKIQAIVINEGFFNMNVIPYLAFILHDASDMVLAFEHLFPRMDPLIRIFRGTRALVLGEAEDEHSDDSSPALLDREQSNEEKPPVPSVPRAAETLVRSAHQRHASHGASLYPSSSKKRKRIHKRLPSTPL